MPQTIYKNSRVGAYAPIRKDLLAKSAAMRLGKNKSPGYWFDRKDTIKVITSNINIVIAPIRNIKENRNSSSPYSENTMAHQDRMPRSNIAHLALLNCLSNFFSMTFFPQLWDSIPSNLLTFLEEYQWNIFIKTKGILMFPYSSQVFIFSFLGFQPGWKKNNLLII